MERRARLAMHPTDLELFQTCPEKYWFSKDAEVAPRHVSTALIKGDAFHRWAAKFVAPNVTQTQALVGVQELRETVFQVALEHPPSLVDLPALTQEVEDMESMATGLVQYVFSNNIKILRTELEMEYRIEGRSFNGTMDVLCQHQDTPPGMAEIWDYKTGRKFSEEWLNRKMQFGHYYIAAGQVGLRVNRVFWAATEDLVPYKKASKYGKVGDRKGQFLYAVHIGKEDVETIAKWTASVAAAIDDGIRYPSPSAICQGCEYNHVCPKFKVGVSNGQRSTHDQSAEKQNELERKLMEGNR